jgi:YidC/Oxa1 family membrane protein insertase
VQRYVIDRYLHPTSVIQSSTEFIVPQEQPYDPLNTEINFIDTEKKRPEIRTEVVTNWGIAEFSSYGAVLHVLDFHHTVDHKSEMIRTIYPHSSGDRKTECFLVGLNIPTPYFYDLVMYEDTEEYARLIYKASYGNGTITKTFKISKSVHKIDLQCDIEPVNTVEPITVRIFYPSPFIADIAEREAISALIINNQHNFERIAWKKLNSNQGWFAPVMFGSEDIYFMHLLSVDHNAFVKRAYYAFADKNFLVSVLEGPQATQAASWNLSFYCGPKTDAAVNAVDIQLEQMLGYAGIFAPLSKLFLKILNFLFDYVGNYGIAIILLTLLLKLLMFPFTMRSDTRIKEQQEMARNMQYLKQRYKDDPVKLAQEQTALIKKHGIPGLGCLPMLLQIPILISMRTLLSHTIQLYHAPFLWISDLSVRDPYYILPLLLVFSMFGQAANVDKTMRMILIAVGLVLGAMMAQLSAGLVLYFVAYGLLSIVQTKIVRYFKIS